MKRLRVLWVAPVCPYPAWGGNHQRHLGLLRATASRHDVVLVYPTKDTLVPDELRRHAHVLPVADRGAMPSRVERVMRRLRDHADCFVPRNMAEIESQVAAAVVAGDFDVAFASLSVSSALDQTGAPLKIVDEQNVEAELYDQLWRREPVGLRRLARWHDAKLVDRVERNGLARASLITVCSAEDAAMLRARAPHLAPLAIVPNGVDPASVTYFEGARADNRVLMVGGMSYAPNVDGAIFLARDVMPLVWRERPDALLDIVGSNPEAAVRELAGDRVRVTGTVEDVGPYLRQATVEVVPLRTGGGTRLKILEAMAAGVPVVSTAQGAAGLTVADGVELHVADSALELSRAILKVMREPAAAREMARVAHQRMIDDYNWTNIGERFVELIEHRADAALGGQYAAR